MSCYKLAPTDADQLTCRVGWDRSVESFYLYIARPVMKAGKTAPDSGRVIKWRGQEQGDLPTIEELEREIEGYAHMTAETRAALIQDQQRATDRHEAARTQGIC